jgi:hypothetical protein
MAPQQQPQLGGGDEQGKKVPRVLCWGNAKLMAVCRSPEREVCYPDGMKLEIVLSPEITLVETIRVLATAGTTTAAVAEHMFSWSATEGAEITSDFHRVRLQAFQECLLRISPNKKLVPSQRFVIFGVSHQQVQEGVRQRFTPVSQGKATKKQVRWGDDVVSAVEEDSYGGWGLEKVFEIPNRYQLRSLMCFDDAEIDDGDFELLDGIDDDAEEDSETEGSPRKKLRICIDDVAESADEMPPSPPPVTFEKLPSTKQISLEDEIKEFDMWLLENDQKVL